MKRNLQHPFRPSDIHVSPFRLAELFGGYELTMYANLVISISNLVSLS